MPGDEGPKGFVGPKGDRGMDHYLMTSQKMKYYMCNLKNLYNFLNFLSVYPIWLPIFFLIFPRMNQNWVQEWILVWLNPFSSSIMD